MLGYAGQFFTGVAMVQISTKFFAQGMYDILVSFVQYVHKVIQVFWPEMGVPLCRIDTLVSEPFTHCEYWYSTLYKAGRAGVT